MGIHSQVLVFADRPFLIQTVPAEKPGTLKHTASENTGHQKTLCIRNEYGMVWMVYFEFTDFANGMFVGNPDFPESIPKRRKKVKISFDSP